MRDCPNVEMRERLPDLLHGQLSGDARARVTSHLADCADCRAELEVLTAARQVLARRRGPRLDAAAIARAIPRHAPAAHRQTRVAPRHALRWQVAAAAALVVLGGAALALILRGGSATPTLVQQPALSDTAVQPLQAPEAPAPAPLVLAQADTPAALPAPPGASENSLAELADEDLEALIGALDRLDAAPLPTAEVLSGRRVVGATSDGVGQ